MALASTTGCLAGPRTRAKPAGAEHGYAAAPSECAAAPIASAQPVAPPAPTACTEPGATTTSEDPTVPPTVGSTAPPVSPTASPSIAPTVAPPVNPLPGNAPAAIYAALDHDACKLELKKRSIAFTPADPAVGVDFPIRLAGKLHGVDVHGQEPPLKRATSVYEILDCRLALALDDFTAQLEKHTVVEVVHFSMYRPPPKGATKFQRHDAALAIDLGYLVKKDGTKLRVLEDWHGGIGQRTCGAGAGPSPATKEAVELRKILCDAADAQLFQVMLTPNYNAPHANHFHLEVTRGVKWFLVH